MQQRRQPRPAKFWAWRPPSSVICRSDTAALPKVSTGLPTNSIELERLRAQERLGRGCNADFSPMSRSQLLTAKPHVCSSPTAETASPRYALLYPELPTLPQRPSEKSGMSVCKNLGQVSRYTLNVGKVRYHFDTIASEKSQTFGLDGRDSVSALRHCHRRMRGITGHLWPSRARDSRANGRQPWPLKDWTKT